MGPAPEALSADHATATPAMRQYLAAKRRYPDAIVFFRMGDFYEMFYEDAVAAARALELTLTSRSKDTGGSAIPMCGVPHHAAEAYLIRLVKQGFRVAVCEQVEDPKKAKGLVRREVVRVVSPGTLTDAGYLDANEPAFLMAIVPQPAAEPGSPIYGVAAADVSTGEFRVTEHAGVNAGRELADEVAAVSPREVLVPADVDTATLLPEIGAAGTRTTTLDSSTLGLDQAHRALLSQLGTQSLEGFGLSVETHPTAIRAAGALVAYLRDTQQAKLEHLHSVVFLEHADYVVIDPATFAHLEVVTGAGGTRAGSLLETMDHTTTAMGGRLLRAWLQRPLVDAASIRDRLDAVEELAGESTHRAKLRETLRGVHDLERLVARVVLRTARPRDVAALGQSVGVIPRVRARLGEARAPLLRALLEELDDLTDVRDRIAATLVEEPPVLVRDGGAIRDGVDPELDELRAISGDAKQAIARMEAAERTRTGIGSLKVRYNRVFGYYIEVSKSNLHAVPEDYHRKQTIASGERYVTPALKDYERQVLGADERMLEREHDIYEALRHDVVGHAPRIQRSARSVAAIDVLTGMAECARRYNYTKPRVHEDDELAVTDGRHPVVERHTGDAFVPNDVALNGTDSQVMLLTGPNMGGKSTYLRQTALITVMAHAGSFVPARDATVPIVDRIFARVGASDNIARGQSTFMLEMQETATILHTATSRSLVLLDEIGRGTATFDGLSIAWAVAEHLATSGRARPKTLFATHYHELTDLADALESVVNYHVAAREWHDDIVFLRRVEPGRSDRSYGIQVAKLAGLPAATIARAKTILAGLERDELSRGARPTFSGPASDPSEQLGPFQGPPTGHARVAERLRDADLDRMTPIDALAFLAQLRDEVRD